MHASRPETSIPPPPGPSLGPRERIESWVARAIPRLPGALVRLLAGRPVRIEGQSLDPHAQLLIRMVERGGGDRLEELPVAEARERTRRDAKIAAGPRIQVGEVRALELAGPAGPIPARLYSPAQSAPIQPAVTTPTPSPLALIVYFHGGGHVVGDLDTHDQPCRFLARETGARVIAVDYRLGPEHPFPAAVEDAHAAFLDAHARAGELGVDPARIAVAGDSAGGNLAAAVAQLCAAEGGPAPAFQALIYPVTDYSAHRPSYETYAEGFFLTKREMDWYRDNYFATEADRADPRASPVLAEPELLAGVAPALIVSCGFDPLRDEAEDYAAKLDAAGARVTLRREADLIHGFFNAAALGGRALEASRAIASDLAAALGGRRSG